MAAAMLVRASSAVNVLAGSQTGSLTVVSSYGGGGLEGEEKQHRPNRSPQHDNVTHDNVTIVRIVNDRCSGATHRKRMC
ncbi:MAG: hypothetical protein KatS3mg054_0960 [Chloroflexus sp.]|nr:MAG: hypothetical protein KatS3mg054_0960 [Chloroflexus sp.]